MSGDRGLWKKLKEQPRGTLLVFYVGGADSVWRKLNRLWARSCGDGSVMTDLNLARRILKEDKPWTFL